MDKPSQTIKFSVVDGPKAAHDVVVYSLSTCAFCRRAIGWLKEQGVAYRYAHIDLVDVNLKRAVKQELKERFENIVVFPILVVDDQRALSGFTESAWAEALELK